MPTISVNDAGAMYFYEDSGAPDGLNEYLTIIALHGASFHSANYKPMMRLATANNVRIIAPNLRDYPGSTAFTDEEMARILSPDNDELRIAIRDQGLELANFIKNVIVQEKLPPRQTVDGKPVGGVAVLCWSISNVCPLSMLANEQYIPGPVKTVLQQYLRTIVMYEPPHQVFGAPLPKEIYHPGYDLSIPPAMKPLAFGRWVGSFYSRVPELPEVSNVQAMTRPAMQDISDDPWYIPIVEKLSREELSTLLHPAVHQRSLKNIHATDPSIWKENAERALFDVDTKDVLKDVDILLLWGDMTIPVCIFSASYYKDRTGRPPNTAGRTVRSSKFAKIDGGNHMTVYLEPEKFLSTLLGGLN